MTTSAITPPLPHYSGRDLPVRLLNPDQFEDFIFACLQCIAPTLGLRITGEPSGTGDGGFDVQAERIDSKQTVCVQCKHQKNALGLPQVAEELAKVAANSVLEKSTIAEHRFICSGGVSSKLRSQLRETSRQEAILLAGDKLALARKGELLTLKKRLQDAGHDPRTVAESYVRNLDRIVAWDIHEFDVSLSSQWNDVLQIVQRFFQVETVVREFPRALFDRATYIDEHRNVKLIIEPRLSPAVLPASLTITSAADPGLQEAHASKTVTDLSGLAALERGDLAVVLGSGGAGKTEVLRYTHSLILRARSDSTLPILFSLTKYTPGDLDRVIHQELGVIHGTWRSLPDQIVLLCDGFNECASEMARAFLNELEVLLKRKQVACIIAMRDAANRSKFLLPPATYVFARVDSLTPIGIRNLAYATLHDKGADEFVREYRAIADTSSSPFLWTPFAVRAALKLWQLSAQLPATLGAMLEVLLALRSERNAEQGRDHLDPNVTLLLASALAFEGLIVTGLLEYSALKRDGGSMLPNCAARTPWASHKCQTFKSPNFSSRTIYCADPLGVITGLSIILSPAR
jgi:hypothetical protein